VKVLIVDDEPLARLRLRQLLEKVGGVEIVGEAASAQEARTAIERARPDVLLLDVQMPGLDGISFAREVNGTPAVIFTTAHREHAVEAFDVAAADYLLKPVLAARLRAALERVSERGSSQWMKEINGQLAQLKAGQRNSSPVRLTARDRGAQVIFDASEVPRFSASDKYVVFTLEGREMLLERSLNELEEALRDHDFLRVHRSELVNLRAVRRLISNRQECAVALSNGEKVQVSRRLLGTLKERLGLE
jgi:two-component system LytT family response regulator